MQFSRLSSIVSNFIICRDSLIVDGFNQSSNFDSTAKYKGNVYELRELQLYGSSQARCISMGQIHCMDQRLIHMARAILSHITGAICPYAPYPSSYMAPVIWLESCR